MELTPAILKCMRPADRAIYDPMKLSEPVVVDEGKQTGLEKELQRLCEHDLSARDIWYLHLSPRAREKIGCPDLLFVIQGVAWAVELKSATGVLNKEQEANMEQMSKNGWRTAVVRSFAEWRKVVFGEGEE